VSVGKIALFGKALVVALARGALAMCAMWVGFLYSFFAGGRKKQNKFPSNLHCPVKKLNPFYFQFITIVTVCSSVFYTCCQRLDKHNCVYFCLIPRSKITGCILLIPNGMKGTHHTADFWSIAFVRIFLTKI
jgi:hypothetical protein